MLLKIHGDKLIFTFVLVRGFLMIFDFFCKFFIILIDKCVSLHSLENESKRAVSALVSNTVPSPERSSSSKVHVEGL